MGMGGNKKRIMKIFSKNRKTFCYCISEYPASFKKINWKESSILITGGTGSFGRKLVKILLSEYKPRRLAVFSRDVLKQSELKKIFPELKFSLKMHN